MLRRYSNHPFSDMFRIQVIVIFIFELINNILHTGSPLWWILWHLSFQALLTQAWAFFLFVFLGSCCFFFLIIHICIHFSFFPEQIMAIGDGENDVEMLQLASFSVALENGSEKAKSVAKVIGSSNDEDGVAEAIYKYVFWATGCILFIGLKTLDVGLKFIICMYLWWWHENVPSRWDAGKGKDLVIKS